MNSYSGMTCQNYEELLPEEEKQGASAKLKRIFELYILEYVNRHYGGDDMKTCLAEARKSWS